MYIQSVLLHVFIGVFFTCSYRSVVVFVMLNGIVPSQIVVRFLINGGFRAKWGVICQELVLLYVVVSKLYVWCCYVWVTLCVVPGNVISGVNVAGLA